LDKAKLLACCLLILPLVGTVPTAPELRTPSLLLTTARPASGKPFEGELRRGTALFAAGHYSKAAETFQTTAAAARNSNDPGLALRATSNAGACRFVLHQYESALEAFQEARGLANRLGDTSKGAALDINIASVYSELGEIELAARWIETSAERIYGDERRRFLPKLLIQMAVLRAGQGRLHEAESLFHQGIDTADGAGDAETYALGCNRMGEAFLLAGDLERAEPPLVEAFRVRKLQHLPLDTSYHRLGRLRLAQGDLISASNLLDRAVELAAHAQNLMPAWDIYYSRGLVRLRQGRTGEALNDLRIAVRLGRDWRCSVPAAQAVRISAQSKLEQASSALIEAAGNLYTHSGEPRLASEAFAAAEANRAWGDPLDSPAAGLPAEWWEAVSAVEHAEAAGLPQSSAATRQAIEHARADLARIAASAGVGHALSTVRAADADGNLAERVQSALPQDAALFSFHLGDKESYIWAIDRDGMTFRSLPPRTELERQVGAVTRAIENGAHDAAASSAGLFEVLFGAEPARILGRPRWLLSLDQNLFELPVAALVERRASDPVYVAERHVIQVIPGVLSWLEAVDRPNVHRLPPEPAFLGIGDAIYNTADSRRRSDAALMRSHRSPFQLFAAEPRSEAPALPRLAGSTQELAACVRAWRGGSTLLEGTAATRARLTAELRHYPAIIHFATHFVASADDPSYLIFDGPGVRRTAATKEMIALSLNDAGQPELLTSDEIARWPVRAELVSLSGCHSAAGAALPGIGLLGLTRAWLTSGARAVAGSLWDTPDSSGPLFAALYRSLSSGTAADVALALNSAQREMIRSGGWRSQPRYWGAYFVVAHD
jgi:CHAT domain-containing protein